MDIFWRLALAHVLADFTFQTDWLVNLKKENVWGVFLHSAVFLFIGTLICAPVLGAAWLRIGFPVPGWVFLALLAVIHFFVDWFKIRGVEKGYFSDSLYYFTFDQIAHFIPIAIFYDFKNPFVTAGSTWLILGVLFVLVTHCMTIVLYYIKKDFFSPQRIDTEKKYIFIGDRLIVWLAFLLEGVWCPAIISFWIGRTVWLRIRRRIEYSWVEILLGYALTLALGFVARKVYL